MNEIHVVSFSVKQSQNHFSLENCTNFDMKSDQNTVSVDFIDHPIEVFHIKIIEHAQKLRALQI